jgi:hypothetical protein
LGDQTRGYAEGFTWRIPFIFYTFSMGYSGFLLNYVEKLHLAATIRQNMEIIGLAMFLFGLIGINGIFILFRRYFKYEGLYLLLNLFFPIIILVLLWKFTPLLSERYLSFLCIFYYLLLAVGIGTFQKKWIQYLLILLISLFSLYSLRIYYFHPTFGKEQWRDVAHFIQENEKPDEVLLFHKDFTSGTFNYYYQGHLNEFGIPERAVPGKEPDWIEIKSITRDQRISHLEDRIRYNLPLIANITTLNENISKNDEQPTILNLFDGYRGIWFIESQNFDTKNFYPNLLNKYFHQESYQLFPKMNGIHLYYFKNEKVSIPDSNNSSDPEKKP